MDSGPIHRVTLDELPQSLGYSDIEFTSSDTLCVFRG